MAAGVAARGWNAWATRCITEPDPAVVGLMARHMAALKEWPLFFDGQSYMGSLEPMGSALLVRLLGATGFALNLGPALFAALALAVLWRWARDAAGPGGGLAAALAGLFGPAVYFQFQTAPRGGYMVALLVESLALWAAARMAARLRGGGAVPARKFFGLGLVAGIGLWSNMIVAPALGAAALALAHGMRWRLVRHWHALAAGVAGTACGLGPWLAYNARRGWVSLDMSQVGGHEPPLRALANAWRRFALLHDDGKTLAGSNLGAALALAVLGLALAGAWRIWADRRRATAAENYARGTALLFCALFAWTFATSGFTRTPTARYWVPAVPGLAVLAAAACAAPGGRAARLAARGLLGALVAAQGVLAARGTLAASRRAEGAIAVQREIGEALEKIGVDALMAPLQLYSLNFALGEAIPVSNGKQKFYEPILRAAELAERPAYSSDYSGIETFLRQRGFKWDSVEAGGRRLVWNVRPRGEATRELPGGAAASLRDGGGEDLRGALGDRDADTWWEPGAGAEAVLEWAFAEPADVETVWFLFAHGMGDDGFDFARRIRIDVRCGGEWETVLEEGPIVPLEASGPRVYHPFGAARLEYRVGRRGAEGLRAAFLDTRPQAGRLGWRLAEAWIYVPEDGVEAPTAEAGDVDALGEWLRGNEGGSQVHAPRWVSGQLLRRGHVPRERLQGLSTRVFPLSGGMPAEGAVDGTRDAAFVVERRRRAAALEVIEGRCRAYREATPGAWTVISVAAGDWLPEGLDLPPAVLWDGEGPVGGNGRTRAGEALRRLRAGEATGEEARALLAEAARLRPAALSALPAEEVMRLGGETAAEMRCRASRLPERPGATDFANGLRLEGIDVEPERARGGETVEVRLYWSAGEEFEPGKETVFVHLRGADGKIAAQDDYRGSPLLWGPEEARPLPGEMVEDRRRIRLPEGMAAGPLDLWAGLYDAESGRRVRIGRSAAPETRRRAAVWPAALVVEP